MARFRNDRQRKRVMSMFQPARHKYLAEMVSLKSPSAAKDSVQELNQEFFGAKTGEKKLVVARATQLAANRAFASTKRKNLSEKEKKEFKEIGKTYSIAAKKMFEERGVEK